MFNPGRKNKETKEIKETVKRSDSADKLDIEASLGEIVKATYNRTITEESKEQQKINGTLRAYYRGDVFYILSDDPNDMPQLKKLTPWLGDVEDIAPEEKEKWLPGEAGTGISASTKKFDHKFIASHLASLKISLNGQHPLEVLAFKRINDFLKGIDATAAFDEKTEIAVSKSRNKDEQKKLTTTLKRLCNEAQNTEFLILDSLSLVVKAMNYVRKKRHTLEHRVYLDKVNKLAKKKVENFDEKFPEEEQRNLFYLGALIDNYKGLIQASESITQEFCKIMRDDILIYLKKINGNQLIQKFIMSDDKEDFWNFHGDTVFHNLLDTPDLEMSKVVILKALESNIDLNHLPVGSHPFCYIYDHDSYLKETFSPLDYQELIRALIIAGVTATDEVRKAITDNKIPASAAGIILGMNYQHFKQVSSALDSYLAHDTANIVTSYLFDGKTVELSAKAKWQTPVPHSAQSHALFSQEPKSESKSPEEAAMCNLFKSMKIDRSQRPLADLLQPWLAQVCIYVESLEKSLAKEEMDDYEKFKSELRGIEKTKLRSCSDDEHVLGLFSALTIPKICPDVLREQIAQIKEMQQGFKPGLG